MLLVALVAALVATAVLWIDGSEVPWGTLATAAVILFLLVIPSGKNADGGGKR